ncbi:MAG: cupin domain-containing protein [Thiohalocapsa sp.]|uniref:cupin domain-containing protein n=1 Tax=Thiohalocapsa sp. TaxID=2497641 RepID=UPI0025E8A80C|nr:cupin domain-containing protein [Thiohalocapsa sp.]MCG6940836.1 cupin domain-containing protein [Thiohalocapsa sp.]
MSLTSLPLRRARRESDAEHTVGLRARAAAILAQDRDHAIAAAKTPVAETGAGQRVARVSTPREILGKQRLPMFVGISAESAGAKGLCMHMVVIPPGGAAEPHTHAGYETAIYLLEGRVETRYGAGLKQSIITEAGDFLFIPPNVPHQPVNLSDTQPARAIVARNDPDEQENVVPYDPAAAER